MRRRSSCRQVCHVIPVSREKSIYNPCRCCAGGGRRKTIGGNTNFEGAFAGSAAAGAAAAAAAAAAFLPKVLESQELAGGFGFALAAAAAVAGPAAAAGAGGALAEEAILSPMAEDDVNDDDDDDDDDAGFLAGTAASLERLGLDDDTGFRPSPRATFLELFADGALPSSSIGRLTPGLRLLAGSLRTPAAAPAGDGRSALEEEGRAFLASRSLRALSFSRCWKRVVRLLANSLDFSSSDLLDMALSTLSHFCDSYSFSSILTWDKSWTA